MTRYIYFIREKTTGTWCYSSEHSGFSENFETAAIFLNEKNATKAIKVMNDIFNPKKCSFPDWTVDGTSYSGSIEGFEHFREVKRTHPDFVIPELKIPEFEVVKFAVVAA